MLVAAERLLVAVVVPKPILSPLASVTAEPEITTVVPVWLTTVTPEAIPAPKICWPSTMPVVLVNVSVFEAVVTALVPIDSPVVTASATLSTPWARLTRPPKVLPVPLRETNPWPDFVITAVLVLVRFALMSRVVPLVPLLMMTRSALLVVLLTSDPLLIVSALPLTLPVTRMPSVTVNCLVPRSKPEATLLSKRTVLTVVLFPRAPV